MVATKHTNLTKVVAIGPNGEEVPSFVVRQRFRWERFDSVDPDEQALYGERVNEDGTVRSGFMAKIRMPTWGEIEAEDRALTESEDAYWKEARPRIVAWNARMEDVNGVEQALPAPADHEDNWQAPFALERPLVVWLFSACRTAHLSTAQRDQIATNRAEARAKRLAPSEESAA